jgi:FkbM family methyltransferase
MPHPLKRYLPKNLYSYLRSLKHQRRKSLSQVGQDFWVFGEVFNGRENGFFLEIGSADGITLNNTFLLEKRFHWRGICIEANPESYEELVRVRGAKCLNICVDEEEREVEFIQRGLCSGIVDRNTDLCGEVSKGPDTLKIRTKALHAILREHNAPETIDYFSIDVEGAEDRILAGFPFSEYRFLCLTIERPKDKLRRILRENGYMLIKDMPGLDCFYIHESFASAYEKNAYEFWSQYGV